MIRRAFLVWLIAVVALLVRRRAMAAHAMAVRRARLRRSIVPTMRRRPIPVRTKDTAKHAAGECCPLMSGAVALLPATMASGVTAASSHAPPRVRSPSLIGLLFTQDPPPPRV